MGRPRYRSRFFNGSDLLVWLDRHTKRKAKPAFRARICVGVVGRYQTQWWIADLQEQLATHFSDVLPEDFSLAIGLGEKEACEILGLPAPVTAPSCSLYSGDRDMLTSFAQHFLPALNTDALMHESMRSA